jgi:hypothetical protein
MDIRNPKQYSIHEVKRQTRKCRQNSHITVRQLPEMLKLPKDDNQTAGTCSSAKIVKKISSEFTSIPSSVQKHGPDFNSKS